MGEETSTVLSGWASDMVEQYFAPIGLKEAALRQVELIRLDGADDKSIEAVIERVVFAARDNSRRHGKSVEYYLRRAIENEHLLHR